MSSAYGLLVAVSTGPPETRPDHSTQPRRLFSGLSSECDHRGPSIHTAEVVTIIRTKGGSHVRDADYVPARRTSAGDTGRECRPPCRDGRADVRAGPATIEPVDGPHPESTGSGPGRPVLTWHCPTAEVHSGPAGRARFPRPREDVTDDRAEGVPGQGVPRDRGVRGGRGGPRRRRTPSSRPPPCRPRRGAAGTRRGGRRPVRREGRATPHTSRRTGRSYRPAGSKNRPLSTALSPRTWAILIRSDRSQSKTRYWPPW
ncbi:hypothetical protein CLV43_113112 [Umezawaea tangerina]|uniref:Uncharacterized protein n=1 Tax=Umezawaea tangerina TaxID=84725 RepID=A0A2T0SQJ9_9PSEU|nr:hypothetical protein CLV43_113112 [Umezawaea tangerina]